MDVEPFRDERERLKRAASVRWAAARGVGSHLGAAWWTLDVHARSLAGRGRLFLSNGPRTAVLFTTWIAAAMLARWYLHRHDFREAGLACACECTQWLEDWHFARQPYLSEGHWIVFLFVLLPILLVYWTNLEAKVVDACESLARVAVAPEDFRLKRADSPALPAIFVALAVTLTDVLTYAEFRSAPHPDVRHWYHGASWAQVALTYGLELVVIWWTVDGFFVVVHALRKLHDAGVVLRPNDPLQRLGLSPLASAFNACMAVSLAASVSAFVSRVRSSGTVEDFVTAVTSPTPALLWHSPWRVRWPNWFELPSVGLALAALAATCWFPAFVVASLRREEIGMRILLLSRMHAAVSLLTPAQWRRKRASLAGGREDPLLDADGTADLSDKRRSEVSNHLRRGEEEIAMLQRSTLWPNGSERASALLVGCVLFALLGAVPALVVPMLGIVAILGLASRVSTFLEIGLSGRSSGGGGSDR